MTEMTSKVFKMVSPCNKLKLLLTPHKKHKNKYPCKHEYLPLQPLENIDGKRAVFTNIGTNNTMEQYWGGDKSSRASLVTGAY